jgi:hypothetical protein
VEVQLEVADITSEVASVCIAVSFYKGEFEISVVWAKGCQAQTEEFSHFKNTPRVSARTDSSNLF